MEILGALGRIGIIKVILFNDSRKVALGAWIYFTSTPLFGFSMLWNMLHPPVVGASPVGIAFDQYLFLVGIATTLIGGGTLADTYLKTKNGKAEPVVVPAP